jgi:branched-chain amino acid transport system permease protein
VVGQTISLATSYSDLGQVTLGGLATGAVYALLLLGVLALFKVSRSINFAYGQVGMVAAFGSWYLYSSRGWPVVVAVLAGTALAVTVSAATELAVRRIPERGAGLDLVVTLGVFLLLTSMAQNLVDSNSHIYLSMLIDKRTVIGGVYVNGNDVAVVVTALLAIGAFYWLLIRTSLGVSLRASAESPAIARSAGINVGLLRTGTWAAAGLVAAVVGMFTASRLSVDAFYMTPVLIKVFIAGMIGGLDRFFAPLIAAFLLGLYEAWVSYFVGANAATPAVFLLIIVVLALMPKRFAEENREVRA